jgi:hypothetical protein
VSNERVEIAFQGKVSKVSDDLGIVFGFGIVCHERNEKGALVPYFDLQDEHIPERVMLKATAGFAAKGAPMDAMHDEVKVGQVLFSFPLTRDIAKSMGIQKADQFGWMVGVKPDSPEILAKFKSGEWTGFSIGGWAFSKAYSEGSCPECPAKLGAGNCEHQPAEEG